MAPSRCGRIQTRKPIVLNPAKGSQWNLLASDRTLGDAVSSVEMDVAGLAFLFAPPETRTMAHQFTTSYWRDSIDLFRHYKKMGDRALAQCPDDRLIAEIDPASNSIAVIVKHMTGNMRSRWTDFLTSDGEKADRNRDSEFECPTATRADVLAMWESGWKVLFSALESLSDADLEKTVTIRGEPHSVMQAINRQVAHYSYHVGQIVYLARHFAGGDWQSLTIAKKKSAEFNARVASGEASQR
jgi:hypothetical protein